jgi:predicted nucleic acid-binding protein
MGIAEGKEKVVTEAVCDASVLFKLVIAEPDSPQAGRFVRSARVFVPEFVFLEIGNALTSRIRRLEIDIQDATGLLDRLKGLGFEIRPILPFVDRALTLSGSLRHPIYDCLYLALAEALRIPLVSADRRFVDLIRRAGLSTPRVLQLNEAE